MTPFDNEMQDEIVAGEQWLSGFATPSPAPDALQRTKRAVQSELARRQTTRSAARHWAAWHGVVAAAASITLAVTVGWYSFHKYEGPVARVLKEEPLVAWSTEALEQAARLDVLDEGLSDLEELSADQPWALSGASMYDALEGALEESPGKSTGDAGTLLPPASEQGRAKTIA
ncbi:MAG TPA: hypothetical protein VMV94_10295 [Phycisphaerae bacterium]|nr:hypothetical protein [Phycisphaerae bacterium]